MWDAKHGGYYWLVDRQGQLRDGTKLLNPMSYVLEGLAEYALAFHDAPARQEALDLFEVMDRRAHDDVHGGYHVAFTEDWQPIRDYQSGPGTAASSCVAPDEEVHPVLVDSHGRKSSDWHLGLLEALATLYDVTEEADVRARVEELVDYLRGESCRFRSRATPDCISRTIGSPPTGTAIRPGVCTVSTWR